MINYKELTKVTEHYITKAVMEDISRYPYSGMLCLLLWYGFVYNYFGPFRKDDWMWEVEDESQS